MTRIAASPNIVNTAISLVLEPRSQVVNEGDNIVLECMANATPKPKVRWLHGSSPLIREEISSGHVRFIGTGNNSSLLITNAQRNDSGVYTCRVENGDDSVDSTASITVRGKESGIRQEMRV